MPSTRPVIALRLDKQLYDKVLALSKEQGRSLSNFVENIVRKHLPDSKTKR